MPPKPRHLATGSRNSSPAVSASRAMAEVCSQLTWYLRGSALMLSPPEQLNENTPSLSRLAESRRALPGLAAVSAVMALLQWCRRCRRADGGLWKAAGHGSRADRPGLRAD